MAGQRPLQPDEEEVGKVGVRDSVVVGWIGEPNRGTRRRESECCSICDCLVALTCNSMARTSQRISDQSKRSDKQPLDR